MMYDALYDHEDSDVDKGHGVGVAKLRSRHHTPAYNNTPYFEAQSLNKKLPEQVDEYLKRYINIPLIEFRRCKEEINNYIRTLLEKEMGKYENSHTAEWLIKFETIQNEQSVFLISTISANLKIT
jgi:hypothetical protein